MLSGERGRPAVAVIGGGASGALAALALLRRRCPLDVFVVEPRPALGAGVAYSTGDPLHRLNVPAGGLSALPDRPRHFVAWAGDRQPMHELTFAPRALYGAYLAHTLAEAAARGPGRLIHLRCEATSLHRDGGGWEVTLGDGGRLAVDAAVLAVGHAPAGDPPGLPAALATDPRYIRDPWPGGALDRGFPGLTLVLGTGLTAVDVALSVAARDPAARLLAVSRHGLRPISHRVGGAPADPPAAAALRPPTALGLLRTVRAQVALAAASGGDWRDVVNGLRPVTQTIWRDLPHTERHRFVRRLARFWEVHRHRLAPDVGAVVEALERAGRLRFAAGRLAAGEARANALRIRLQPPHADLRSLDVGTVVNCTGLACSVRAHPLLGRLEAAGACAPGPLGLGIATSPAGEVVDRAGRPTGAFALGVLRRGELWETTAIPEIRAQAFAIADTLAERLAAPRRRSAEATG